MVPTFSCVGGFLSAGMERNWDLVEQTHALELGELCSSPSSVTNQLGDVASPLTSISLFPHQENVNYGGLASL